MNHLNKKTKQKPRQEQQQTLKLLKTLLVHLLLH